MEQNTQNYQGDNNQNIPPFGSQQPQMPLYNYHQENEKVMGIGDWILTFLVMVIPLVNIIMVFVWAFGAGNKNRSNWAKAVLIMWVVIIALYIGIIIIAAMAVGGMEELVNELEYM